jgi:hypothetical protein
MNVIITCPQFHGRNLSILFLEGVFAALLPADIGSGSSKKKPLRAVVISITACLTHLWMFSVSTYHFLILQLCLSLGLVRIQETTLADKIVILKIHWKEDSRKFRWKYITKWVSRKQIVIGSRLNCYKIGYRSPHSLGWNIFHGGMMSMIHYYLHYYMHYYLWSWI